jgi:hypothetical protein
VDQTILKLSIARLLSCRRGNTTFETKAQNCQNSGGIGIIIFNNVPGLIPGRLESDTSVTIPVVGVSVEDGEELVANRLGQVVTIRQGVGYTHLDGTSMAVSKVGTVLRLRASTQLRLPLLLFRLGPSCDWSDRTRVAGMSQMQQNDNRKLLVFHSSGRRCCWTRQLHWSRASSGRGNVLVRTGIWMLS